MSISIISSQVKVFVYVLPREKCVRPTFARFVYGPTKCYFVHMCVYEGQRWGNFYSYRSPNIEAFILEVYRKHLIQMWMYFRFEILPWISQKVCLTSARVAFGPA